MDLNENWQQSAQVATALEEGIGLIGVQRRHENLKNCQQSP